MPAGLITLTTDFGDSDWFVGTMKVVILGISPKAVLVDYTHKIAPGDVRGGAFALAGGSRFAPPGTVHLAVVDPGVGSTRKAIAVATESGFFVGPDNGVLSWALAQQQVLAIHSLENERYRLRPVSQTFHGRDIFAPAAAHLSRGVAIEKLGPKLNDYVRLDWPTPRKTNRGTRGEVVYIDRFGNAITNIAAPPARTLSAKAPSIGSAISPKASPLGVPAEPLRVFFSSRNSCPVATHYQAVPNGRAVAVCGSSGWLEIAVNGGDASRRFRLRVGDPVELRPC